MGLSSAFLATVALLLGSAPVNKYHIGYLMQKKKAVEAVDLYEEYRSQLGRHDFEVLEQLGMILLDEGARSDDSEKQLMSIFGSGIAGIFGQIDILEAGILSSHMETQLASIQALARLQDDRSEELLNRAMSSEFLYARMEAAYGLAGRKARTAVGQIEGLMHRLPREMRVFFPEFFAMIGTQEAILALRELLDDPQMHVKVAALLSVARYGRDDLLPIIRSMATHSNPAELEAAAYALGALRDSKSIEKLERLMVSAFPQVQVTTLLSLYMLGDPRGQKGLEKLALEENLFAITALGQIPGAEEVVVKLLKSPSETVRINAGVALLKLRDPRCLQPIFEILVRDGRGLGIEPHYSLGHALVSWKLTPLAKQKALEGMYDLMAVSLSVREQVLIDCLELPERDFLRIAEGIFHSKQTELVPLLTTLVQNLGTPEAIDLLQKKAETAGAPLIRTYCSLALYRMHQVGPYEEQLRSWIRSSQSGELIRFRPVALRKRNSENGGFEITPEEGSRLLIEAYQALAERHEIDSIELLLEGIKTGNPKNRYVLAGLLLHAMQ